LKAALVNNRLSNQHNRNPTRAVFNFCLFVIKLELRILSDLTMTDEAQPSLRAGTATFVWKNEVIFGGGEGISQVTAHQEMDAFSTTSKAWRDWPPL